MVRAERTPCNGTHQVILFHENPRWNVIDLPGISFYISYIFNETCICTHTAYLKGHWCISSPEAQTEHDIGFGFLQNTSSVYKKIMLYWFPVILWMGAIFWMSTGMFAPEHTSRFIVPFLRFLFPSLLPQDIEMIHGVIRKAGHVTEYFILGLLLFRAFRGGSSQAWRPRWTIYTIIGVVFYAATDEYHQSFSNARMASLLDVGIDSAGGILSQISIMLWRFRKGN